MTVTQSESQPKITTLLNPKIDKKHEDEGLVLAEMAAIDNISFLKLAKSKQLRKGFVARCLNIPTSDFGVKRMVFKYAKAISETMKRDLARRISENDERFSISLDEYTSKRNRR